MTGDVVDAKCEWSTPFEKGKSTFRTVLKDERGEENTAIVTITGENDQLEVLINVES